MVGKCVADQPERTRDDTTVDGGMLKLNKQ